MNVEIPASSRVNPANLVGGLEVDPDYSIYASPVRVSVTKGAIVRYTLLYEGFLTTQASFRAPGSTKGPEGDIYTWYKFADRSLVRGGDAVPVQKAIKSHIDGGGYIQTPYWDCEWDEEPGRYIIGCQIISPKRKTKTWCFYAQHVASVESLMAPMLAEVKNNGLIHPEAALAHQEKYVADIKDDAARLPPANPDLLKRHQRELEAEEKQLAALRAKIEPWQNRKYFRVPVSAVHLSSVDQVKRKLNVYLVKTGSTKAYDEIVQSERGWKKVHHPKMEQWRLVDYTIPGNLKVCQEAEGDGETDEAAIQNVFKAWNFSGNRYEPGWISYSVKLKSLVIEGRFETNGRTAWDTLTIGLNVLSTVGMVVVGAAALVCPVPGAQVVSYAIWTSLLSSTAAAGINMAQRLDEGSGTWQENAIDGLTIVSNLIAGAGQVARIASAARAGQGAWGKGAAMALADDTQKVAFTSRSAAAMGAGAAGTGSAVAVSQGARMLLLGQVATDAVQGILVLDTYIKEYDEIISDSSTTPKGRVDRLLSWIGRLVMDGGLMYVSFRGNKAELDAGKKTTKYLKGETKKKSSRATSNDEVTQPGTRKEKEPNPWADDEVTQPGTPNPWADDEITLVDIEADTQILPVQEKLDRAGSNDQEVTVRVRVPVEGHTNPKNKKSKNRQTVHETKARTHMRHDQHQAPKRKIDKHYFESMDPNIWRDGRPIIKDDEILLRRKMPGKEDDPNSDLIFWAKNKKGYLHVEIVTTHRSVSVVGGEANARQIASDASKGLTVHKGELYVEELRATELYPFMFDHFEEVAKRTGVPIKGIDGHFAMENMASIEAAIQNPALRSQLVLEEFGNGSAELVPEALKHSKTWKFWEDYAQRYGYSLEQVGPVRYAPDDGVYWRFRVNK